MLSVRAGLPAVGDGVHRACGRALPPRIGAARPSRTATQCAWTMVRIGLTVGVNASRGRAFRSVISVTTADLSGARFQCPTTVVALLVKQRARRGTIRRALEPWRVVGKAPPAKKSRPSTVLRVPSSAIATG